MSPGSIDSALRLDPCAGQPQTRAGWLRRPASRSSRSGLAAMRYGSAMTRSLKAAQLATNQVETANIDLQDELAQLRDKVAASNRDLAGGAGPCGWR